MSRLSTSAISPSTVIVKKVTFSQMAVSRGWQGNPVVGTAPAAVGIKRQRHHLVESKKFETSQSITCKPLLSPGLTDPFASNNASRVSTAGLENSQSVDPKTTPRASPDYFGVKSHLHHFYETVSVRNPDLYEELEGGGYVNQPPKKPNCRSIWWKVAVGCGINLLVIGIVVILVGYLVPRRPIFVAHRNELEVVDRAAIQYNYNLDACKLIGMIVFCIGGITVAVALLFPSFFYNYIDLDWSPGFDEMTQSLRATVIDDEETIVGLSGSHTEKSSVPTTEQVTKVQPTWDQDS